MNEERDGEQLSYVEGLIRDLPYWTPEARRDLCTMIINFDGHEAAARLRDAQIGLLVELILEENEQWITEEFYDDQVRACDSDRWPLSKELAEAFGGWKRVLKTAQNVARGERRGMSHHARHWKIQESKYGRTDFINAIWRCREALGYWPSFSKYAAWAEFVREQERSLNKRNKYFTPPLSAIVKYFGGWPRALEIAKEVASSRERSRSQLQGEKNPRKPRAAVRY